VNAFVTHIGTRFSAALLFFTHQRLLNDTSLRAALCLDTLLLFLPTNFKTLLMLRT
jgi:hypothetical protein